MKFNIFSKRSDVQTIQDLVNKEMRNQENNVPIANGGIAYSSNTNFGGELTLSTVYCAIETISSALSVLPVSVKCYDIDANEPTEWLEKVFKKGLMPFNRLVKQMVYDMLLFGNGYAYIRRNSTGRATELEYVPSHDVVIKYSKEKHTLSYRVSYIGEDIKPKDMIHILKNTRDGYTGIGVLNFANRTVSLSNSTEQAAQDYYKNGLNFSGLLHAKQPMTKIQANQALNSIQGTINTENGKYIKFIPFDLEFQSLQESAQNASLNDTRRFNISEVARFFCISPALLQDLKDAKYSNIEAANIQFLTNTLLPYVVLIETELNLKLVPEKSKLSIDFDEKQFLRTDAHTTANYYKALVESGILSINEARENIGYKRVHGASRLIIPYTNVLDNTVYSEGSDGNKEPLDIEKTVNSDPKEPTKEELENGVLGTTD